MNKPELFNEDYRATYCPESNKLHLYVGRVPRPEYDALRAEGWTSTPKQSEAGGGEFAATWTPERRDTALSYAGIIEDEDMGPAERAADRAERFGGYLDKRLTEAGAHADNYDGQPMAHGFQSAARAERAAAKHDRQAGYACDAWSKAEYWQRRTAGVISNALYKSTPAVRMGRIKELEAYIRKSEKTQAEYRAMYADFQKIAAIADPEKQTAAALHYVTTRDVRGDYMHPHPETVTNERIKKDGDSLYVLMQMVEREDGTSNITGAEACALYFSDHGGVTDGPWTTHYRLRLAYETQMLEAQGGRAAYVEMEVGGWLRGGRHMGGGERQITKVNKSPKTGRVVSVIVRDNYPSSVNHYGNPYPDGITKVLSHTIETERLSADAYRAPTDDERQAFAAQIKGEKAKAKVARAAVAISLINPTDADAERLQALWNERALATRQDYYKRNGYNWPVSDCTQTAVLRITQAAYSANSKGEYARASIRDLFTGGELAENYYRGRNEQLAKYGPPVAQIRRSSGGNYSADHVIVLTDKPQKPLPASVWQPLPQPETVNA